MAKKLTLEEFDKRVKEALTGPLPSLNGTRRSQPRLGVIKDLLKGRNGGVTPTPQTGGG